MKFKFWNDLSDEQKEKLLKKICGIGLWPLTNHFIPAFNNEM